MTFDEAQKKINVCLKFGIRPGLERIKKLLSLMDNPQDKLKFIHTAGTNGKGSICSMIAFALTENGYRTGLFTSPFVIDFRERFKIDNRMITEEELVEIVDFIYPKIEALNKEDVIITEFEFITAIAFEWFYRKKCDIVVLEVGLGGRFDATNVIKNSLVSVISSISYDHMAILGDTLSKIAYEKAGIIKESSKVVLYPEQQDEVKSVIKQQAKIKNAELIIPETTQIKYSKENYKAVMEYKNISYKLPLCGEYQIENTVTVLEALKVLKEKIKLDDDKIKRGIEKTVLPARLEILNDEPLIFLDGAHNEDAMKKLKVFIDKNLSEKKVYAVMGILKDKDYEKMISVIAKSFYKIITVEPDSQRKLESEILCKKINKYNKNTLALKDLYDAVKYVKEENNRDIVVIICGSLYLAKDVKRIVKEVFSNE
ncbi:MAG: folylpolyglutamate synthase/dihydrofolate synthase family protein [Clostridia bacterium]|nr:folylpolyglutamate synthase/dihydrofolate synthase family protein [Clostridia bacterium]